MELLYFLTLMMSGTQIYGSTTLAYTNTTFHHITGDTSVTQGSTHSCTHLATPEPCQVYPPGEVRATLSTLVSLRQPSSAEWIASLSILSSQKHTLYCFTFSRTQSDFTATVRSGNCTNGKEKTVNLSTKLSESDWLHLGFEISNSLSISIVTPEKHEKSNKFPILDVNVTQQACSVSVETEYETKFNCPSECSVQQAPHTNNLQPFKHYTKNEVMFSVLAGTQLKQLLVQVVVEHLNFKKLEYYNQTISFSPHNSWSSIKITFTSDNYLCVDVDGDEEASRPRNLSTFYRFSSMTIYYRGSTHFAFNCHTGVLPRPSTKHIYLFTHKSVYWVLLVVDIILVVVEIFLSLAMCLYVWWQKC